MNLISLIICLVLSGLMLSVGVFYNGSSYTASKIEAKYVKLMSDMSEISQAAQAANAQKYEFIPYEPPTRSLVKGGFLSSAPHFDKKFRVYSILNYKLYKNTYYMASDNNSDWTVVRIVTDNEDICVRVNQANRINKIPFVHQSLDVEWGGEGDENQPVGAIVNHIYASGNSLIGFVDRPDLIADTVCFLETGIEMEEKYVISHIINVSEASNQLKFEISQTKESLNPS